MHAYKQKSSFISDQNVIFMMLRQKDVCILLVIVLAPLSDPNPMCPRYKESEDSQYDAISDQNENNFLVIILIKKYRL